MNSHLYECVVMHKRKEKIERNFDYRYFMFYLDLDEIDLLSKKLFFFSRNRFNLFSFRDRDHLAFEKPSVMENIRFYLGEKGVNNDVKKIYLLTNVATMGYNFNPVSFYYCFDDENNPVCVVPEVGNTFGELKPFFMNKQKLVRNRFEDLQQKYFYVSPFIDHDVFFKFNLGIPGESLSIKIDDYKDNERIFITSLFGKQKTLSDINLIWYFLKFPFVTIRVITAIHWQAMRLYLRKIKFYRKEEKSELQKGVVLKWKKQNI